MNTKQLRQKFLSLAIEGKLVPQDANDEPAIELLKRINPKFVQPKYEGELPQGWSVCTIGDIFEHNTGKALNKSADTEGLLLQYLTTSNVYWNRFDLTEVRTMYFKESEVDKCTIKSGDLLVCEGGDIGRSAIWKSEASICIQNHIHRLRAKQGGANHYFYMYILMLYKATDKINGKGIGLLGLSSRALDKMIVPLPPLAEQKRIVERLEYIFALIDTIEQAQDKMCETIKATRQKLLSLAIDGKLVLQNASEEPAIELLKYALFQKEILVRHRKIKKSRSSKSTENQIINTSELYKLPEGWVWCKLIDICHIVGRIGFRGYTANDLVSSDGAITLSPTNIIDGKINYDKCTFLSWKKYEESPEIQISNGDILLVKTASIGKCALVENLPQEATINPQFVAIKYIFCDNKYLTYVLQSTYAQKNYNSFVVGTAIPTFKQATLETMPIPLPPLAEQKRIVEKLENLFSTLDSIESNLK